MTLLKSLHLAVICDAVDFTAGGDIHGYDHSPVMTWH